MKNFIAGLAMFLLLMFFPLQMVLEISNDYKISAFNNIVYVSLQQARSDGCFTDENIENLRVQLKEAFGDLHDSDIHIDVEKNIKYRTSEFDKREAIYYDISVPINKIIAAPAFFGIPESKNQFRIRRKGFVLSERLP